MFYIIDTFILWICLNICAGCLYYADSVDTKTIILVIGPAVILMDLWIVIQIICFIIGRLKRLHDITTEYVNTV